jgi:CHAT domain-containing protein/tetratricopeptide (TPR) repeat protein
MASAAQQPSASANPPAAQDAKGGEDTAAPTPRPRSIEEARAGVRAAEAAHPGNTSEVAAELIELVYAEILYAPVNEETLATTERAVKVAEAAQGKQSRIYGLTLAAKARVLQMLDRPEVARPMAEESLAILQRVGWDHRGLSDAASTLSLVCEREGDKICALRNAEIQVQALREVKDEAPVDMASALIGLMHARRLNDDMTGGKAAADEAMDLAAHFETPTQEWAILENNAGAFYMVFGDFQRSYEHLKKGLDLNIQLNGPDSMTLSGVLANLGYVEMCLGNTSEALSYYAHARSQFAKVYGPQHSMTTLVDSGYGYALTYMGRYQEAMEIELGAHRMQRERIRLAIKLMPEQQALAMANTGAKSFNIAVTLATRHPAIAGAPVYQEVVRSRAMVADEMAKRQAVLNRKLGPESEVLKQELEKEGKTLMALQGAPPSGNAATALADATLKMEQTERKLAERSAAVRADERAESSELGDLRKNMPPGSVLVSYVAYAKYAEGKTEDFNKTPVPSYMAFVLHRDSENIGVYDLGDATPARDLILKMRASADAEAHGAGLGSVRNEREYREAGLEVRKRIWDPLKADLENAKLVLVVPDGSLNLVPFSALPSGNGYMVEQGPVVHILTSEKDLLPQLRGDKKAGLLAVGGPSFELAQADAASNTLPNELRGGPIKCEAFTQMEFHPLPASLDEVKDISSTFKRWNADEPERMLTGEDATRSRFLDAAPQSRILHIATHAFLLDKSCGNGNPLLHSGLVFAGANKSRDSSILTAQQIAAVDLRGVDWAVLSACDTGSGELKDGEGVLGLERAFRVAGANSVIMALWPIDDQVTREFMRDLYAERFARRATTADAVWNAARKLLKDRQAAGKSTHPWYWAGFVGSGGWQ